MKLFSRLGLRALKEQDEKSTLWTTWDIHRSWGGWRLLPSEVETGGGQPREGKGLAGCASEHRNESRDVSQVGAMSQLHRSWKSPMKDETSWNFTESLHIFTVISLTLRSFYSVYHRQERHSCLHFTEEDTVGLGAEDLPQSPWSLAHSGAMELSVPVVHEQTWTCQKCHCGCLRWEQQWDRSGGGEPPCRKLGSGFAGVPCP